MCKRRTDPAARFLQPASAYDASQSTAGRPKRMVSLTEQMFCCFRRPLFGYSALKALFKAAFSLSFTTLCRIAFTVVSGYPETGRSLGKRLAWEN